jgi:hypothetical protein
MNFISADVEESKRRSEYEQRTGKVDWDNLEYQNVCITGVEC